jgi:hypothetical protein
MADFFDGEAVEWALGFGIDQVVSWMDWGRVT